MEGGIRLGALLRLGAGRRASGRDAVVLGVPASATAAVYNVGIATQMRNVPLCRIIDLEYVPQCNWR